MKGKETGEETGSVFRGGGGAGRPVAPFWPALLFQRTRENFFCFFVSFGRNDEGGTERLLHESCTSLS